MPRFTQEFLAKIVDALDFVSFVQRYVRLEQKGDKYWGLSPFKVEKTPSFSVDPNKKLYYCFSTGQGGNSFTLVQKLENANFYDAVSIVAKAAHIELPFAEGKNADDNDGIKDEILGLLSRLSATAVYFLNQKGGVQAKEYLMQRGISEESSKQFKLGYLPKGAWVYDFLKSKKYSDEILKNTGLFSKKYPRYCLLQGRLVFPLLDRHGHTVGFGGRTLDESGPKYINSSETLYFKKRSYLYGYMQYLEGKERLSAQGRPSVVKSATITEGYLDVVALHQAGVAASFAPLGTAFTFDHAKLLRAQFSEVGLMFDSDSAGQNASYRAALELEKIEGIEVKICLMDSKDPADIVKSEGEEALNKLVLRRENYIDYLLRVQQASPKDNPRERTEKVLTVARYVAAIHDPLKTSLYIERMSDFFGIPRDEVRALVSQEKDTMHSTPSILDEKEKNSNNEQPEPLRVDAEFLAMCAVIYHPSSFVELRKGLSADDLENYHAKILYNKIELNFRLHGTVTLQYALDSLPSMIADRVNKAILQGEVTSNPDELILDFLKMMKKKRYKKRANQINLQLRRLSHERELQEQKTKRRTLLEEKKFIDFELNLLEK